MTKPLVVVESPTKVRTLKKYLGSRFNVAATKGHIKDLPQKEIGIDIEKGFVPKYRNIPGKQKTISSLKRSAGDAMDIYLAPDPDREGEAIAWHTAQVLKKKGRKFHRVLFHELTRNAIQEAIANPTELDENKYEAQQARRILDRLVGYQISPLLWRKVKSGLSAGRVQSVAVRIICERERAIQAFIPEEYWSITALLEGAPPPPFEAKLVKKNGKKFKIPDEETATAIVEALREQPFVIDKILKKTVRRNPQPPFITSKLQQEAIRKLKFSAKKTMVVAQQLYEGIDLGPGEPVGLITYMRTDSTRIAKEAAEEARELILEQHGEAFALNKPRFFKNRKKAQDAHEAIRPTSVFLIPDKIASHLTPDQFSLYRLIWQRFVASQMKQALIDQNTLTISSGIYGFSATGSVVRFPGFMALYQTAEEEDKRAKEKKILPDLAEGSRLALKNLDPRQHFTQPPPPRFSEASLVKELEDNGIGRPSTYAAILSTIREKGYVDRIKGYFRPSELGFIVNDLVVDSFPDIFDVAFTAKMENDLDLVESHEADSQEILKRFYGSFKDDLERAADNMLSVKGVGIPTGLACPDCSSELRIKMGKNGHFLACSSYPDCKYSRDYSRDEKGVIRPVEQSNGELTDRNCPKCDRPLLRRQGKYGDFLACSGYPDCRYTESTGPSPEALANGMKCPEKDCGGKVLEKKSKRGKTFYGCSNYPDCRFATWDKPEPKPCPVCGAVFLVEKTTKKDGTFLACATKDCGYRESAKQD